MNDHLDNDNFPNDQEIPPFRFPKPKQLLELETMPFAEKEAMDDVEVQERIEYIAHAIAQSFWEIHNPDFEECVDVVAANLRLIGSSIGGKVGQAMVARSEREADKACRIVYDRT